MHHRESQLDPDDIGGTHESVFHNQLLCYVIFSTDLLHLMKYIVLILQNPMFVQMMQDSDSLEALTENSGQLGVLVSIFIELCEIAS